VDVVAIHVEEGVLGAVVIEIGREAERLVEGEESLHVSCGNDGDDGSQAVLVWHVDVSGLAARREQWLENGKAIQSLCALCASLRPAATR
jgi:hypothetical protein